MIGLTSKVACAAVIIYYWWRLWEGKYSGTVPTHSARDFLALILEKNLFNTTQTPLSHLLHSLSHSKKTVMVWSEVARQKAALPAFDSGCVDATLCLQTVAVLPQC